MKYYDIIGYTADAAVWCHACLKGAGYEPDGYDHEGNDVHPIFAGMDNADEEACEHCHEKLMQ
jgi:hypothetical protein